MSGESKVYRAALQTSAIGAAVLLVVASAIGAWIASGQGVIAAVAGVAVAALAGLTTQGAMLVGHRQPPNTMAAIVAGSWLLKMIIIVILVLLLGRIDDFHRPIFAITMLVGVIGTLVIDVWALLRARVPYVEPGSNPSS